MKWLPVKLVSSVLFCTCWKRARLRQHEAWSNVLTVCCPIRALPRGHARNVVKLTIVRFSSKHDQRISEWTSIYVGKLDFDISKAEAYHLTPHHSTLNIIAKKSYVGVYEWTTVNESFNQEAPQTKWSNTPLPEESFPRFFPQRLNKIQNFPPCIQGFCSSFDCLVLGDQPAFTF